MHIKNRRGRALLYRSTWVPKDVAGDTHGYNCRVYVGSIVLYADATSSARIATGRGAGLHAAARSAVGRRAHRWDDVWCYWARRLG